MALQHEWDIRQESYGDGASVTSVTDQVGTADLDISVQNVGFPTYSSSEDEIVFAGGQSLGVGTVSTALEDIFQGTVWTIAVNLNTANPATADFVFSAGNSGSANLGVSMVVNAGVAEAFVRNSAGLLVKATTASEDITPNTDSVVFIWRNGSTIGAAVGDGAAATNTGVADLSGEFFDQIGFGAHHRASLGNYYTGGIISARIYNSDESANRASISSEMLTGAAPSATITDIDGDNDVQAGQPSAIITTTGIDPASVTQSVTLGGETLTINSWGT